MLTFGLNYDIKEGHEDEFEEICFEAIDLMKTLDGHEKTRLYQDVDRPNSYLIYSEWATREDFTNFIHSEAFEEVQNMGRDMLAKPPSHNIYTREDMH